MEVLDHVVEKDHPVDFDMEFMLQPYRKKSRPKQARKYFSWTTL